MNFFEFSSYQSKKPMQVLQYCQHVLTQINDNDLK